MVFADESLYIYSSPTHLLSIHVTDQGLLVGNIFFAHAAFYFSRRKFKVQSFRRMSCSFSPMSPGRTLFFFGGRDIKSPAFSETAVQNGQSYSESTSGDFLSVADNSTLSS